MASLSELIDEGIHAFARGQMREAERYWREALELDPGNRRLLAYLSQLQIVPNAVAPTESAPPHPPAVVTGARPVPLPPPTRVPGEILAAELEDLSSPLTAPEVGRVAAMPLSQSEATVEASSVGESAPSPWDQGPATGSPIELESDGGLDFSAVADKSDLRPLVPERARLTTPPMTPKTDVEIWMGGARELFALGDFSGSLEMIEKILKVNPNHAEAWAYLKQNEATLIAMYESKLGALSSVPRLAIKPEEVMWLNLDHRAGFLLAQIDGTVNYEDLFSLSGLPRLDTAKILATLLNDGVIR